MTVRALDDVTSTLIIIVLETVMNGDKMLNVPTTIVVNTG